MFFLWRMIKYSLSILVVIGLAFSSGVFSVLLYSKITGKDWSVAYGSNPAVAYAENQAPPEKGTAKEPEAEPKTKRLAAPLVKQYPELPAGCEVTSLTMLLQYAGIQKSKMELVKEMKFDPTGIKFDNNGNIAYWGNPNLGFVGDVYGRSRGFGVYHTALIDLLEKYIPSGVDLTKKPFHTLEQQLIAGIPVVVWTTVDYLEPTSWVVWDSPLGPIQTTFAEHAVLLTGFDENKVYVNDPLSGRVDVAIDKEQFIRTWTAMGKQAISYKKNENENERHGGM